MQTAVCLEAATPKDTEITDPVHVIFGTWRFIGTKIHTIQPPSLVPVSALSRSCNSTCWLRLAQSSLVPYHRGIVQKTVWSPVSRSEEGRTCPNWGCTKRRRPRIDGYRTLESTQRGRSPNAIPVPNTRDRLTATRRSWKKQPKFGGGSCPGHRPIILSDPPVARQAPHPSRRPQRPVLQLAAAMSSKRSRWEIYKK